MKRKTDVTDLYFIFADNRYEGMISYDKFKALINFYSLLYDKVLIPDTFFINNSHLNRFLLEDGLDYIEAGIIVPTVRTGTASLTGLYQSFLETGTLIERENSNLLLTKLDQVDLKQSFTWNINDIAMNFTNNMVYHLDTLNLSDSELFFKEYLQEASIGGFLTRKDIHQFILRSSQIKEDNKKRMITYTDVHYNFNIPNFLGTSAAYPEPMNPHRTEAISPESIYFNNTSAKMHSEMLKNEDFVHTNFFNEGILASLNIEQICHLRKLKEYKRYLNNFKKSSGIESSQKLEGSLYDYIDMFERELPLIISREIQDAVKKEKMKLTLKTLGRDTISSDGVGFALGLVVDGITGILGGKAIGSVVNIMLKPLTSQNELALKKLKLRAEGQISRLKSPTVIHDTMKSFSINTLIQ